MIIYDYICIYIYVYIYLLCSRIPELIINQQGWVSQNHCSRNTARRWRAVFPAAEYGKWTIYNTYLAIVIFYNYVNVYQRIYPDIWLWLLCNAINLYIYFYVAILHSIHEFRWDWRNVDLPGLIVVGQTSIPSQNCWENWQLMGTKSHDFWFRIFRKPQSVILIGRRPPYWAIYQSESIRIPE